MPDPDLSPDLPAVAADSPGRLTLDWVGSDRDRRGRLLLGCVYTTRFSLLRTFWRTPGTGSRAPLGTTRTPNWDLGGGLAVFDLDAGAVVGWAAFPTPTTIAVDDDGLWVANRTGVARYTAGRRDLLISHPWFNDLRSVSPTGGRLLVASSGVDAVLEVSHGGTVTWAWWAADHGYAHTPLGERRTVDRDRDHRGQDIPMLAQTTHVNSAVRHGDVVLASLCHQGQIVAIDPAAGAARPVVDGLRAPHSLRRDIDGLALADSGNGRALWLDHHLRVRRELTGGWEWVIDSAEVGPWTVVVDNKGCQLVLTPGGPYGGPQRSIAYDPDWDVRAVRRVDQAWLHASFDVRTRGQRRAGGLT
jgi:hypothetical protein